MNLTSRVDHPSNTSSLKRCPSCEMPATAGSWYCGSCGCDLSPQSEFSWHEDRFGVFTIGRFGWEAG